MKKLSAVLSLLLVVFKCVGQHSVTGEVIDHTDKKPVAYATVLLNNTSWAIATNDNGSFVLKDVRPGHYTLIVSCIGYEPYKVDVFIDGTTTLHVTELKPSSQSLQQVTITGKFKISSYFNEFKRAFIGTTDFAKECKISNPWLLHFDYDRSSHTLHVASENFLKIENNALGYIVHYLLNDFTKNDDEGTLFYEGATYFEEMKGTAEQQQIWHQKRMLTYQGSAMEFLRSLTDNTMTLAGFEVNPVIRQPNEFYNPKKDGPSERYLLRYSNVFLKREAFTLKTDQKGLFAITSKLKTDQKELFGITGKADTCLCVCYFKSKDKVTTLTDTTSTKGRKKSKCTVIRFNSLYAFFDYNGVIINPMSVSYQGNFSEKRVGDQLPDNFQPNI